ncbi:hypothetical protein ES703_12827 [subsurface metagenome]
MLTNQERLTIAKELRARDSRKHHRSAPSNRQVPPSPKDRLQELEATAEQSYDQLEGEWHDWLEVAKRYEYKVPSQDRYDMRHDIILELHRARQRDGKPLPLLRAYRIASLTVALYWRKAKRLPTILSLDQPTTDYQGNELRLLDTVADDTAIDLDAWLDASLFLLGCPMRLIEIATKRRDGIPLNERDRRYFNRHKAKELKRYQIALI